MTLAPAPASPEPAGSAVHGVGTCDTGGGIRTVQVTGLFDLSPSLVPSREVHEEPAAGTSPVSKGPTGTGAAPASWGRSSVSGRCILQAVHRPGSRGTLPRVVAQMKATAPGGTVRRRPSDAPMSAGFSPHIPWAMRGPDRRTTVILRRPSRLFAKDGQPSKSRSKQSGEPLLLPPRRPPSRVHDRGCCPLYVRAQLETAGSPMDTARRHSGESNSPRSREHPGRGPFSLVVAGDGFEPS